MGMTLTDAIAFAKESQPADAAAMIAALQERHPRTIAAELARMVGTVPSRPFAAGLARASEIPAGEQPLRLWFGLYPAAVTLLIGETGAGKSSLLYNIAVHAARNEPLWGVQFGHNRPIRILYLDPENAGSWEEGRGGTCAARLDRIDAGRPVDLHFHDGRGLNLANAIDAMRVADFVIEQQIDLLIIDPIANLFSVADENDNAEAARNMKMLTQMSRELGCSIVACHHTGKDNSGNYGRGASARLAAADVGVIFRVRGQTEEIDDDYTGELQERDDVCRLQIVKNRMEGRASIYLRMEGEDRFGRVPFAQWKTAAPPTGGPRRPTQAERAMEEIQILLIDGCTMARTDIMSIMSNEGIGERATDQAIRSLKDRGLITSITGAHNQQFYHRANPAEELQSDPLDSSAVTADPLESDAVTTELEGGEEETP